MALQEAEQEFVAKVEAALQANEVDEDQLIEERRKRRQQILAKHQQEQAALPGTPAQIVRLCCYCGFAPDCLTTRVASCMVSSISSTCRTSSEHESCLAGNDSCLSDVLTLS